MLQEIAVLDQVVQVILDRPTRCVRGTDDVLDLDLSALPRQFVDAQGQFRKLS